MSKQIEKVNWIEQPITAREYDCAYCDCYHQEREPFYVLHLPYALKDSFRNRIIGFYRFPIKGDE